MIVYTYNPAANPAERSYPGVPLSDITAHVWERLTAAQRASVEACGWYAPVTPADDKPATTGKRGK